MHRLVDVILSGLCCAGAEALLDTALQSTELTESFVMQHCHLALRSGESHNGVEVGRTSKQRFQIRCREGRYGSPLIRIVCSVVTSIASRSRPTAEFISTQDAGCCSRVDALLDAAPVDALLQIRCTVGCCSAGASDWTSHP